MRVWLDPNKLYALSLTTDDVVNALRGQNQQVTAGQLGMPPAPNSQAFQYTLDIATRLDQVDQFENIVVKTEQDGRMVHLRDVARIELGAQTYSQIFTLNGKPAAGIGTFQTLEANALDVAGAVKAKMDQLAKSFPPGLAYSIPFDTTTFVRASINEVWKTLFEAAPTILVHNGRLLQKSLARERISLDDLHAAMRRAGVIDVEHVHVAMLEENGGISVIPRASQPPGLLG